MPDHKKWFKVWNSILTDPTFLDLPVEQIGRWTLLGSLVSLHGENGQITLPVSSLKKLLRVENDNDLRFPNVEINAISDNGMITVIMKNWLKYQLDSTGYERLKRYRKAHNDNGTREDKTKIRQREEEDKEKIPPNSKSPPNFKSPKIVFGEFKNVLLTEDEYLTLIGKFGEPGTKEKIENLSSYIASKGKKYSSHYATILMWDRKNGPTQEKPLTRSQKETKDALDLAKRIVARDKSLEAMPGGDG